MVNTIGIPAVNMDLRTGRFELGRIYYYKYNPKFKERLAIWDRAPLVFPLRITASHTLGINLHWVPFPYRKPFLNFLIELSKKQHLRKKLARITYDFMRGHPMLKQCLAGLRLYINSRISYIVELPREAVETPYLRTHFLKHHKARKIVNKDFPRK